MSGSPISRVLGRYVLHNEIASGGMASVHFGRLTGAGGFSRTVAIKRLHPHIARDADFAAAFLDEARLSARIRHPNVIQMHDVVAEGDELFLVMEYVHGESLAELARILHARHQAIPLAIARAIGTSILYGLHAAHETAAEDGSPLHVVHRDVSPANVLVGADGIVRVVDFGIAKATSRLSPTTREGHVKGKLAYMATEQIRGEPIARTTDTYSAAVVIWEMLAGRRLFAGENEGHVVEQVLLGAVKPPSAYSPKVSSALDEIVMRGLAQDPKERPRTAQEMASEIESIVLPASAREIGAWLEQTAAESLAARKRSLSEMEGASGTPPRAPLPRAPEAEAPTPTPTREEKAVSTDRPTPTRMARWLTLAIVLALGIGLGAVAVGLWLATSQRREAAHATVEPLPSPPLPIEATAIAAASTTGVLAPQASSAHSPPPSRSPRVRSGARTVPSASKSCDPPFTRDETGHIVWKRECL